VSGFTIEELSVWRHIECRDCPFTKNCPKEEGNLKACALEDRISFRSKPLGYLIKRTLRYLCAEDRRQRREKQRRAEEKAEQLKREKYNAILVCADSKEFSTCQN
jgi:hypothetical protein